MFGIYIIILLLIEWVLIGILDIIQPAAKINKAFRVKDDYKNNKDKFGDH